MIRRSVVLSIALLGAFVALAACTATQRGELDGKRAGAERGTQEGEIAGRRDGHNAGTAAGQSRAQAEARTGAFWEIYVRPVAALMLLGIVAGIAAQFTLLLRLRHAPVAEWIATLTVPALAHTSEYTAFLRLRDIELRMQEALVTIRSQQIVQVQQMQTLERLYHAWLSTAQSLEAVTDRRTLELFEQELAAIVEKAEQGAGIRSPRAKSSSAA